MHKSGRKTCAVLIYKCWDRFAKAWKFADGWNRREKYVRRGGKSRMCCVINVFFAIKALLKLLKLLKMSKYMQSIVKRFAHRVHIKIVFPAAHHKTRKSQPRVSWTFSICDSSRFDASFLIYFPKPFFASFQSFGKKHFAMAWKYFADIIVESE